MKVLCAPLSVVLIVAVLSPNTGLAQQSLDVATLWKARGLKAIDVLEKLQPKLKKGDKKAKCEAALEFAFASHVNPKLKSVLHKVNKNGHFFSLVYHHSKNKPCSFFGLQYIYSHAKGGGIGPLTAIRIDKLPSSAEVMMPLTIEGAEQFIMVVDHHLDCTFFFHKQDPFLSSATD